MAIKHTHKQEDALRLLGSDARHILLRGGSRCVSGDTVLDGHTKTIAQMSDDGLPVKVVTSHGIQWAEAPFRKGDAELLQFELSDGRTVTVTDDHRFWSGDAWVKAGDLFVGDKIACASDWVGYWSWLLINNASAADDYGVRCNDTPAPDSYSTCAVLRTTRTAVQPYYTLHVPVCEHYFANGIMHHNSGKTFILMEALLSRALAVESRHAILRFRANALKSITGPSGTLYDVLDNCFPPEVRAQSKFHKQDGYYMLPNGSEIWFGGLDDRERAEKILGNEYSTIYFNECSQIPWGSHNIAMTRLAQTTELRQKAYYDANPPPETHWLHRVFAEKRDPDTRRDLADPNDYASLLMNPMDNKANLDEKYLQSLDRLPERQRKRFYLGLYGDAGEAALWTSEILDQQRILSATKMPDMLRIVVSVDPSGADDIEDATADEIGIVVIGLGVDGNAYVLEDLTMKGSPAQWGLAATEAYERHEADCVVAEVNFGGAMVRAIIQGANPDVPYREVTASRAKHVRAEPVAALYENGKVFHVGRFSEMEDEMISMTTAGYTGTDSPNRLDALVWGITELFPKIVKASKRNKHHLTRGRSVRVNTGHSGSKRRR